MATTTGSHAPAQRSLTSGARARFIFLLFLLGTETHCAPSAPPPALPFKAKIGPVKTELPPPTWLARFSKPAELKQCTAIRDGVRLCVGALGERWLDEATGAYASPYLAPEDLVAAIPTESKGWVFVGRHGTRFSADSPLGPLTSVRLAPRKFSRFAVEGGRWFGITDEGELWQGALGDAQGARAVIPERLFDLALSPNGHGLVLGVPERLWHTQNHGAEWNPLDVPSLGVRAVAVDEQGELLLSAVLAEGELKTHGITIRTTNEPSTIPIQVHNATKSYTTTQGLLEGRAARLGKEILELRYVDNSWYLARSFIDSPVRFSKIEGLDRCTQVRFAVSSLASLVLCKKSQRQATIETFAVFTSNAHAERFQELTDTASGRWNEVQVVAVGTERFLATGLCPPELPSSNKRQPGTLTQAQSKPDCRPTSPLGPTIIKVREAPNRPPSFTLSSVNAPGARVTASKISASVDGLQVAFVARKPQFDPWRVYISDNAGKTFVSRSIDELPVTGGAPATAKIKPKAKPAYEDREILSLNFGHDRSLALVYRDRDAPFIANFDARGELVATTMAPPTTSVADAVGSRILAFSRSERNVYESLDRGASFELVDHLPGPTCANWGDCTVRCFNEGCLVGDRFTRLGWGGRGEPRLDIAADPETAVRGQQAPAEVVSFRTPLVCKSNAKAPGASTLAAAPTVEQVGLHNSLWVSLWQDWSNASAGSYRVLRGLPRVEKTIAFAPLKHVERAGLAFNFDNAGPIYLRSESLSKGEESAGELEFAWMPARRSTWMHARFHDESPIKDAEVSMQFPSGVRRLSPEMLAVSGESAYVKLHADDVQRFGTTIATGSETRYVRNGTWPVPAIRDAHWINIARTWNIFAFDSTGSHLLRAAEPLPPKDAPWKFTAQTAFAPFSVGNIHDHAQFDTSSEHPYLVLFRTAKGGKSPSLTVHELSDGPAPLGLAVSLPLPATLNDPPEACTTRDRRELRRAVVPLLPKAARTLGFVDEKGQTHWLVVSMAVMYASEKRACIDALWGDTLPGLTPMSAVVSPEDLKHSWVFLTKRKQGASHVEAHLVDCHFDATAHPPPELEARVQARFNFERPLLGE